MNGRKTLMALFLAGVLLACSDRDSNNEARIQELFDERIERLTARTNRDCARSILEAAQVRADSLLRERVRRMRRIEGRPPRPRRPGEPPRKQLSSPLPLRPLFPFEIRFDTLLRDSLYRDSLRVDSVGRGLLPPAEQNNPAEQ